MFLHARGSKISSEESSKGDRRARDTPCGMYSHCRCEVYLWPPREALRQSEKNPVKEVVLMEDVYLRPKIPDGEYIVEFVRYYTAEMFREKTPKVCMEFAIVQGEYEGFPLERFYSAGRLIGSPGEDGGFKAKSQTCIMLLEYCACFPNQEISRLDRIPMSRWKEGRFSVFARSTKLNHQRRAVPAQLQFSVIHKIVKRVEECPLP